MGLRSTIPIAQGSSLTARRCRPTAAVQPIVIGRAATKSPNQCLSKQLLRLMGVSASLRARYLKEVPQLRRRLCNRKLSKVRRKSSSRLWSPKQVSNKTMKLSRWDRKLNSSNLRTEIWRRVSPSLSQLKIVNGWIFRAAKCRRRKGGSKNGQRLQACVLQRQAVTKMTQRDLSNFC